MVLGDEIMRYKFFFASIASLLLVASCQAANEEYSIPLVANASTAGTELALENNSGKCSLKVGESSVQALNIPYPCGFVHYENKQDALIFNYPDVGDVLIVAGPPAAAIEYKKFDWLKPGLMCSNHGQAIIVKGKDVTLRKSENIELGFCHNSGFDEKTFYGYAYPVN